MHSFTCMFFVFAVSTGELKEDDKRRGKQTMSLLVVDFIIFGELNKARNLVVKFYNLVMREIGLL